MAGQYYFHRFYEFQPDLNTANPAVRREILKIMGFWLELGIAGFRVDAVPFIIEAKGAATTHRKDFELLHDMRDLLQWRCRDAILLAEANVPPDESKESLRYPGRPAAIDAQFPGESTALVHAGQRGHRTAVLGDRADCEYSAAGAVRPVPPKPRRV